MGQSHHDSSPDQQTGSTIEIDETLSTDSKRQQEDADVTSVFGKRTMGSDLVFLRGILPGDPGENMRDSSISPQTEACFDELESILDRRDLDLGDVMKIEIHLTDPDAGAEVDRIYESRFADDPLPPRTVVGVCSLPGGADVQLDVVAVEE